MESAKLAERFAKLENTKLEIETYQEFPVPKIQRIPPILRDRSQFARYFSPRMISLGPIHHHLQLGEQYKLRWTKFYLDVTMQSPQEVHNRIANEINHLRYLFPEDATGYYSNEDLAWMFFIDGCSVLYLLKAQGQPLCNVDQWILVVMDLLLLENQLPYKLLSIIENPLDAAHIFLGRSIYFELRETRPSHPSLPNHLEYLPTFPNHLLDHLRRNICVGDVSTSSDPNDRDESIKQDPVNRGIQELKAGGIQVKRNVQARCLMDIKFCDNDGVLRIPRVIVSEHFTHMFLNMIAYEMCPDFSDDHGIMSYFTFLNSLIQNIDDLKELREAGVLIAFGSDQELFSLLRTICADLVSIASFSAPAYACTRSKMNRFYDRFCNERRRWNKYNSWILEAYNTYFRSPWTIIAWLGALFGLFLTAVQTWYTVYHK